MNFSYKDYFNTEPTTGYETLVYDCMIGDAMLFNRADAVEAGWAVVQPILDLWKDDKTVPLELYPAGGAGPSSSPGSAPLSSSVSPLSRRSLMTFNGRKCSFCSCRMKRSRSTSRS